MFVIQTATHHSEPNYQVWNSKWQEYMSKTTVLYIYFPRLYEKCHTLHRSFAKIDIAVCGWGPCRQSGDLGVGVALPLSIDSFFFNFYCYSITVVCVFSPSLHPTPAESTSLPRLHPPPSFCPCVLYSSSCNPLKQMTSPPSAWFIICKTKRLDSVLVTFLCISPGCEIITDFYFWQ